MFRAVDDLDGQTRGPRFFDARAGTRGQHQNDFGLQFSTGDLLDEVHHGGAAAGDAGGQADGAIERLGERTLHGWDGTGRWL